MMSLFLDRLFMLLSLSFLGCIGTGHAFSEEPSEKTRSAQIQEPIVTGLGVWLKLGPPVIFLHVTHAPKEIENFETDDFQHLPLREWIMLGRSIDSSQSQIENEIERLLAKSPTPLQKDYYYLLKCVYSLGCIAERPSEILRDVRFSERGSELFRVQCAAISHQMEHQSLKSIAKMLMDERVGEWEKKYILHTLSAVVYEEMIELGVRDQSTLDNVLSNCEELLESVKVDFAEGLANRKQEAIKNVRKLKDKLKKHDAN